jgi:gliding motility-associated lipoprotein GldD
MKMLKKRMRNDRLTPGVIVLLLGLVGLSSCGGSDPTPKPKGYYKIELPDKSYQQYTSEVCPFSFEYPEYAEVQQDSAFFDRNPPNPCWLNLSFPQFSGTIHISYKKIGEGEALVNLIEDMHELTFKHTLKAEYIDKRRIRGDEENVTGLMYEVGGNAASSTQFFVTDSANHFLRGALYFSTTPNEDSLAPVVNFVKKDIQHMVKTFQWTDTTLQKVKSL